MARLPIRIYGDPVLRKKAKPVRAVDAELQALIEAMIEAMWEDDGAGLAAPQLGVCARVIVVHPPGREDDEVLRLINPRIIAAEGTQQGTEGCLSLPTLRAEVERHQQVQVEALTPAGEELTLEAEGLLARVLQHEIDHLNGVLFIDRADKDSLSWLVPDVESEDGFRLEPTTWEEAQRRFARMRAKHPPKGATD